MIAGEMLRSGLREAPPASVVLTAGPLSVEFAGGEVRNVRVGDEEVLRRLYVAVRDRDWGTVPLALSELDVQQREDGFRVAFVATHATETPEPIHFVWRGAITGDADGTLTCAMNGAAETAFLRNRIGWCVLHPPAACAGQPCTVTHPDGTTTTATFPVQIAPHQPFLDIRAMAHGTPHGNRVSLTFDGDTFETEDQRNWTDDSYKTYGTPLALPYPVRVAVGEAVRQSVTLRVSPSAVGGRQSAERGNAGVTITIGTESTAELPCIGLGVGSLNAPLTERELRRLVILHPDHLRADLRFGEGDTAQQTWAHAVVLQHDFDEPLHVALFLPDGLDAAQIALNRVVALHDAMPTHIARWLVFDAAGNSSPPAHLALARDTLGPMRPDATFGGGTDAFFTHLNRTRPPQESLDFVTFSINPQVHAFDNRSIAETPTGQTAVVASAAALYPGLPVIVSPVTLRPRRNPDATAPPAPLPPGTPPPNVDTRQLSLFAAGWTAMSAKHLAEAGVDSITYYETVGPCGVIERESGSPYDDAFPSEPGQVYPLYHALTDIGERAHQRTRPATSSDALRVDAIAIASARPEQHRDDRLRILVANLHDAPEAVTVRLPGRYASATARVLDEAAAPAALRDPETWRTTASAPLPLTDDGTALALALAPYAYACVDVTGK